MQNSKKKSPDKKSTTEKRQTDSQKKSKNTMKIVTNYKDIMPHEKSITKTPRSQIISKIPEPKNLHSFTVIETFLFQNQIKNVPNFILYLSEIWRDLSQFSSKRIKGISKFAFSKYFQLPGLINKRLFKIFDVNKSHYLSPKEFIEGMVTLYCEDVKTLIAFLFQFYDFDNDGFVTKEDIRVILSYMPMVDNFNDMVAIQEEIHKSLSNIFTDKKPKMDLNEFFSVIIDDEFYVIFVPIISYFYENKPFDNFLIDNYYKGFCFENNDGDLFLEIRNKIEAKIEILKSDATTPSRAAENIINDDVSQFNEKQCDDNNSVVPSKNTVDKSKNGNALGNMMNKLLNDVKIEENLDIINNENKNDEQEQDEYSGLRAKKVEPTKVNTPTGSNQYPFTFKLSDGCIYNRGNFSPIRNTSNNYNISFNDDRSQVPLERKTSATYGFTPPTQKQFQEIFDASPGFKQLRKSIPKVINFTNILSDVYGSEKNDGKLSSNNVRSKRRNTFDIKKVQSSRDLNFKRLIDDGPTHNDNMIYINITNKEIQCESYLYKITKNSKKLKILYFKLYNKDLFFYKSCSSIKHQGMHNLSSFFLELGNPSNVKEELDESNLPIIKKRKTFTKKINDINFYCFSLINQNGKIQTYLTPNKEVYIAWTNALKKSLNYKEIQEYYQIIKHIGNGKFSNVYLANDLKNNRKVAIKRINKMNLKGNDLELIKTEVDILKVCQHPCVVTLYDILETYSTFNIVLEYCSGGNFFRYLYDRQFNITESQIVSYLNKIAKAVFSMHSVGIIHRDLKLSNIAMTSAEDNADIRILDFGLSKLLGPGEKCSESYGTPGYAAPEVINEDKYDFKADVWTIGVIAFCLCTGKLPFDYITKGMNTKDLIKNTLDDDVNFDDERWNKFCPLAKQFVRDLMEKDVEKRLSIKDVLDHEWMNKYYYNEVTRRKASWDESDVGNKNSLLSNNLAAFRLYSCLNYKK